MGEIADSMINGEFDAETGEYLGEATGFPRVRRGNKIIPQHSTRENAANGINNYLVRHGVISRAKRREIKVQYVKDAQMSNADIHDKIQEDFSAFNNWFMKHRKSFN